MKKIFTGIGILVAIFSNYFFLLVADKMVFHNNETIYDFELSKSISGQELGVFAKNAGVTIRLVDFKNTSFGKKQLDITFINPDSSITLGRRPSVFPKENIVYKALNNKTQKQIKRFTIQNNDNKRIENMKSLLERNGYIVDILKNETINFTFGMLFSPLNMGFFALLTILLILSIATYYVYRLKEIGVLKLNGWSNWRISFRFLLDLLITSYLSSLLFIVPFGVYVIFSDVSKIILYSRIYLLLCLFLALVFLASAFIGTFFIHNVNQIGAIKNKKNNELIFYILLVFKIVTTVLLVLSMNTSSKNMYELTSTIQSINKLEKHDFYNIRTSVIPEENMHKKLDQLIGSLEDRNVYNYSSSIEKILNITKLKEYLSSRKLRDNSDYSYTSISSNMLEFLNILDERGNKIEPSHIQPKEDTLLIPVHCKNDMDKILEYYQFEKDPKIIYIKNGQVHDDILFPGLYVYDSIYHVHKVRKELYLGNSKVLLNKKSAETIEHVLTNLGLDKNSITVESRNMEYSILKSNAQLDLCESLFHLIINLLSFFLCVVSIVTIFLELRKKEFGVYKFVALNALITIVITLFVNPIFLFLLFAEGIIYGGLIYKYIRSKAVLALKGE